MNKKALIILPVLLAILIIAGVGARIYVSNHQPDLPNSEQTNEDTQPAEDVQPTESTTENTTESTTENTTEDDVFTFALPTEFEPFECSGEYYCFNENDLKNEYGFAVDHNHEEYEIVYYHNFEETVLFKCGDTARVSLLSYIDDSLYFCVHDNDRNNTVYRIAIEYDDEGYITDSKICFVVSDAYFPLKAMKNALIIERENGKYIKLDTLTGEISFVDYNNEVDPDSVNISVSLNEAIKIAENEIAKDKYKSIKGSQSTFTYDLCTDIEPILVHDPDLIYRRGANFERVEDYPEYVWVIEFESEPLYHTFEIFVNAQTGTISGVGIKVWP